jgi:hypothetical protein
MCNTLIHVISSVVLQLLASGGLRAVPFGSEALRTDDGQELWIARGSRRPTPSDVEAELRRLEDRPGRVLVTTTAASSGLAKLATAQPRLVVVETLPGAVWVDGVRRQAEPLDPGAETAPRRPRGPRPYSALAIARLLLASPLPRTQTAISASLGVSQAAVSLAFRRLGSLVIHERGGWVAADPGTLFDWAVDEYPGAGGIATYWWSDRPLTVQADDASLGTRSLISGDLAADHWNGWRVSEHAVVYAAHGLDPAKYGFAAASPDDYTIEITVPSDPTLWTTAHAFRAGDPVFADPVVASFDVLRTGSTGDQADAVARLREWTLQNLARQRRSNG